MNVIDIHGLQRPPGVFYGSFLSRFQKWLVFATTTLVTLIFAGEGIPPGNYGNYGHANAGYSACEEENERLTESLRNKVTAIKSVSI